MILDRIVGPARYYLGDLAPLVAELAMCLDELHLLLIRPLSLINARV